MACNTMTTACELCGRDPKRQCRRDGCPQVWVTVRHRVTELDAEVQRGELVALGDDHGWETVDG